MNLINGCPIWLRLFLILSLAIATENTVATSSYIIKTDSSSAVDELLKDAETYHKTQQYEQAAALLERALRIKPRHPVIWHNLAGVRLTQQDWKRAANLAQKSNALAGTKSVYKELRMRNWVIITGACEGMKNDSCTREARKRAQALARALGY
jgi:cytochrome c-type biogenesis protein CcmH/NrfG